MALDLTEWQKALPSPKGGPMRWNKSGIMMDVKNRDGSTSSRQVTPRPILPTARGIDQDGGLWLLVSWEDWRHNAQSAWMIDADARNPKLLEALSGAPVDPTSSRQVAKWMAIAPAHLTNEERSLATRLGWIEGRFVWSGHLCGREWVGPDLPPAGDIQATAAGVRTLASLPDGAGNLALVILGLSAASPLVRWGCVRNPILGIAQSSSKGKSTALSFALSLWGDPPTWSLQGGSTVKGVQDLATQFPDTPILLEDLHKLHADRPDQVQDLLYYCGNGQRRITSSRAQTAKGGERRCGVTFYAAEHEILGGSMGGVVFRSWELSGHPMPDGATARSVADATQRGRGATGPRLAEFYSCQSPEEWRRALADDFRIHGATVDTSPLSTGDVSAVRCLAHGLNALRLVLEVEMDIGSICGWLIGQIAENRATQVDRVQAGWDTLIASVLGGHWGRLLSDNNDLVMRDENRLVINNEVIAWRIPAVNQEESWEQLDVNVGSVWASRIIQRFGGERVLLKAWAEKGWIVKDSGGHLKWLIRDHGRVAMRVSREQLALATGGREGDDGNQTPPD